MLNKYGYLIGMVGIAGTYNTIWLNAEQHVQQRKIITWTNLWVLHALSLLVLYDVEVAALPVDGLLGSVLGVFGLVPPLRP